MMELLAGIFGLLIGSFLNVCIYRWPRDLSVVAPRSGCPKCEKMIAWYDNIPVVSYLILRARCRHCRGKIHWRYPAVELLTAVGFILFIHRDGLTLLGARDCLFVAILIALGFSDADSRILPDELTLGGAAVGLVLAWFTGSIIDSLVGAAVCSGTLWLGGWIYEKVRHKQGLGLGDVKMLAMIGAFLGLASSLLTILLGSLIGAVTGLLWIRLKGEDAGTFELPFGTFLAIGAFLAAIEGKPMLDWYLRHLL
jgi:leader peptidase (prepilin peptidase)/N-methyltransferase